MRRLSYVQYVVIDIYQEFDREELADYLIEIEEYVEDPELAEEVGQLIDILEKSTDAAYNAWKKEAVGMSRENGEEEE